MRWGRHRVDSMLWALCLVSCVADKSEGEGRCYADSETGVCDCFEGVEEYAGTNSEQVEGCQGYARCYAYVDPELGESMCSCGDDGYAPDPGSTDILEVDGCPEG
jgi:hypothetical protein